MRQQHLPRQPQPQQQEQQKKYKKEKRQQDNKTAGKKRQQKVHKPTLWLQPLANLNNTLPPNHVNRFPVSSNWSIKTLFKNPMASIRSYKTAKSRQPVTWSAYECCGAHLLRHQLWPDVKCHTSKFSFNWAWKGAAYKTGVSEVFQHLLLQHIYWHTSLSFRIPIMILPIIYCILFPLKFFNIHCVIVALCPLVFLFLVPRQPEDLALSLVFPANFLWVCWAITIDYFYCFC